MYQQSLKGVYFMYKESTKYCFAVGNVGIPLKKKRCHKSAFLNCCCNTTDMSVVKYYAVKGLTPSSILSSKTKKEKRKNVKNQPP